MIVVSPRGTCGRALLADREGGRSGFAMQSMPIMGRPFAAEMHCKPHFACECQFVRHETTEPLNAARNEQRHRTRGKLALWSTQPSVRLSSRNCKRPTGTQRSLRGGWRMRHHSPATPAAPKMSSTIAFKESVRRGTSSVASMLTISRRRRLGPKCR
jgi:hypothetical protein